MMVTPTIPLAESARTL